VGSIFDERVSIIRAFAYPDAERDRLCANIHSLGTECGANSGLSIQ